MQYVQVRFDNGTRDYSYTWSGEVGLKTGDRVVVPSNYFNTEPQFATVQGASATRAPGGYRGDLAALLGVVNRETGRVDSPDGQ